MSMDSIKALYDACLISRKEYVRYMAREKANEWSTDEEIDVSKNNQKIRVHTAHLTINVNISYVK